MPKWVLHNWKDKLDTRDDKRDALWLFHMTYHNYPSSRLAALHSIPVCFLLCSQHRFQGCKSTRLVECIYSCCRVVWCSTPLEMIFVNPFASCMEVSQYSRLNVLFSSCSFTLWILTLRILPRWRSFALYPDRMTVIAAWLCCSNLTGTTMSVMYSAISWRFRASPNSALANAMSSASVDDRAVEPCFRDDQRIGYASPILIT